MGINGDKCTGFKYKRYFRAYAMAFRIKCSKCKYTDINVNTEPCYTCCKINDIEVICKECERKEILFRNFQKDAGWAPAKYPFIFKDVEKYLSDRFSKPCYRKMLG